MAKATTCKLGGRIIGIEEALELRKDAPRNKLPKFLCIECGASVTAFKKASTFVAHFEHNRGEKTNCTLRAKR